MAVFNKNTLTQISGFDNPLISGELVYNQQTYWNITLKDLVGTAVNLVGATIDAQIVRRTITNVQDTRTGLSFDIGDYSPASAVTLTITNRNNATGQFTVTLNSANWGLLTSNMVISDSNGVGFSGRILVSFPASGSTPQDDIVIFLFFIVRSDGVVKV